MDSDDEEEKSFENAERIQLPKPFAPSSCSARAGDRKATVWWSKSEENPDLDLPVSYYIVYKHRLDGGEWDNKGSIGEVEAPVTSLTVEFLTNEKRYRFSVVAACEDGKHVSPPSPHSPPVTPCIPLPEPWKQHVDPETQRVYYYNPDTKERSWKRPEKDVFKVCAEVKEKFSERQLGKYRKQFRDVDIDDSGSIDLQELKKLFKLNEFKLSKAGVKRLMKEMDVDNDGSVDFNEYITMVYKIKSGTAASWGFLGLGEKLLAPSKVKTNQKSVEMKHKKAIEGKKRMGDWVVQRDENTNRDYYFNRSTKQSSWALPEDVLWYISDEAKAKYGDDVVEGFKQLFLKYDKDGSGYMDVDELTEALLDLGLKISHSKVLKKIAEFDVDNNGEVDFNEFVTIFTSMNGKNGIRPKLPAPPKPVPVAPEEKAVELSEFEEKCRLLDDREKEIAELKRKISVLEQTVARLEVETTKVTVRAFLEQHGLTRYERWFKRQGITELQQLQSFTVENYEKDLRMKRGHARKCKFALEKLLLCNLETNEAKEEAEEEKRL